MTAGVRLGLRANARQFTLLVALNALVGGLVGLERSVLPLVGGGVAVVLVVAIGFLLLVRRRRARVS